MQLLVERRNVLEAVVCSQLVASALGRTRSALEGCGQAAAAVTRFRQQQQQQQQAQGCGQVEAAVTRRQQTQQGGSSSGSSSGGRGDALALALAAGCALRTSPASGHWAAYCRPPERALVFRVVAGIAGSILPEGAEEEDEEEGGGLRGQQRRGDLRRGTATIAAAGNGARSGSSSPAALLRRGRAAGMEAVLAASGDATVAARCFKQLHSVERVLQSREQAFHKQVRGGG